MVRLALLLGMAAAVLTESGGTGTLECRLDRPEELKSCAQGALDQYRPQLAARFDPLSLADRSGGGGDRHWWLSGIHVRGASAIQVRHVEVRPLTRSRLALLLTVFWPRIGAELSARARVCKRILFFYPCLTVKARPQISLVDATAALSTTWRAGLSGGQFTILPSGTRLSIRLGQINVNPRFGGLAGFIYNLLGNIAKNFVNKLVRKEWEKQRPFVERQLAKNIEQVMNQHVGPALSRVLRGRVSL